MRHSGPVALLTLCVALLQPRNAHSQQFSTESRSQDISSYIGYVSANPGYGPDRSSGPAIALDFTQYTHIPVYPSFELRANFLDGPIVNESSYLVGVRAQTDVFRRFHPYANFLIGEGYIHYNIPPVPGYTHDNSIVPSYGIGADVDIYPHFQLKADFQAQHWAFDNHNIISPDLFTIGLLYHVPFKPHNSQQYVH